MNARPKPTPQDVARLLNGEMDDPGDIAWIMDWHERDPGVARWSELLDVEAALGPAEPPPIDPQHQAAVAESLALLNDLSRSRITAIELRQSDLKRLLQCEQLVPSLAGLEHEHEPVTMSLDKAGNGRLTITSLTHSGKKVRLLNLTVAKLALSETPPLRPYRKEFLFNWPIKVEPVRRGRVSHRQYEDVLHARCAAADDDDRSATYSLKRLETLDDEKLIASCPARADGKSQLAVLDCRFPTRDGGAIHCSEPLLLTHRRRGPDGDTLEAEQHVPLPEGADRYEKTDVHIRAATLSDLTDLDSRTASALLAEYKLTAFPIHATDEPCEFPFTASELESLVAGSTTWLLRWVEEQEVV